jgi:hypothetical protein
MQGQPPSAVRRAQLGRFSAVSPKADGFSFAKPGKNGKGTALVVPYEAKNKSGFSRWGTY